MYCCGNSEPLIVDCTFLRNDAWIGGGLCCENSSPTLFNVSFMDNSACAGGGMATYGGTAILTGCTFNGNGGGCPMGGDGGGFYCGGSAQLLDCTFRDNSCGNGLGGGLCFSPGSTTDVLTIEACTFVGNHVQDYPGAAMTVLAEWENEASATLSNCTVTHNGGLFGSCQGALAVIGITDVTLYNTVIAFATDCPAVYCENPFIPTLICCDIYGNAGGDWVGGISDQYGLAGNFSADPRFCDALSGDVSLQACSPCFEGNHPDGSDCGLIGSLGEGCECGTATQPTTWGTVKAMFR
jgi:hypothetical protein